MKDDQLDHLDKKIISELTKDARVSFLSLSKKYKVASGTIHMRVDKLKAMGIIQGSKVTLDPKSLGFDVCCFIAVEFSKPNKLGFSEVI